MNRDADIKEKAGELKREMGFDEPEPTEVSGAALMNLYNLEQQGLCPHGHRFHCEQCTPYDSNHPAPGAH